MDPQPTSLPIAASAPARRRWWLRYLLLAIALAVVVPLGLFAYSIKASRNDWIQAEAQADQLDPGWRFHELLAKREPIADADNSALTLIALVRKGGTVRVDSAPKYQEIFKSLPPNARLNAEQLALINRELAKVGRPVADARQLKDMPRGRFFVKFSDDFIGTLVPNHHDTRVVGDWLKHDAYRLADEGKIDEAVELCQAILCCGRAVADDLFLIAYLIRVYLQPSAIATLERVLAQGTASEPKLQALQNLIELEIKQSNWLTAIRGERAGVHGLFENVRNAKIKSNYLRSMTTGKSPADLSEWLAETFPSILLKYYPDHLRHMSECVEIAKLPIHLQSSRIEDWDRRTKESKNPISVLLTPGLAKIFQADSQSQAHLRAAAAALACERYRLEHGSWPATLDALVEKKLLGAVPTDPIDGQPLRYRRTKDGIVIYSIGADRTDNQGAIDRERMHEPGADIGFRLWDVGRRHQPPVPAAEPEVP